ncbi:MAG: hypothetical protein OZSIB_4055 [Candidatus Ozemobacter sibiricus]|uniref:Uncharacterized protein n=1 Tax=Candidatus Ozemobacter sibiricus TaxID=2268124 RepID=A0A367ZD77_9BACT|nr:MAG: hypothetical protein OZSIB_4055 [Candidatus Ozemobacter sibiricus]
MVAPPIAAWRLAGRQFLRTAALAVLPCFGLAAPPAAMAVSATAAPPSASSASPTATLVPEECLVIGEGLDPARGRRLFQEATEAWRTGRRGRALDLYEEALIADRSVLTYDDDGMALALLERLQQQIDLGSPTTALLCRKGFFENIIIGDLEAAVEHYRRARDLAATEAQRNLAAREAARLSEELVYIRRWQQQQQARLAALRRLEDARLAREEKLASREDQLNALRDEKEELQARIAYLNSQEAETRAALLTSMARRSRARRYYYYRNDVLTPPSTPAPPPAPYPGPGLGPLPDPPPGAPGPLVSVEPRPLSREFDPRPLQSVPPVPVPPQTGVFPTLPPNDPLPEQSSSMDTEVGSPENLELYYLYRRRAKDQKQEIDQIRAEITGLERRINAIDKEIERLQKQWAEEDNRLPASPTPPAPTSGGPRRPPAPRGPQIIE